MEIENSIKKLIPLPKGGTLEVDATPQFLDAVARQFNLSSPSEVSDDYVRMYVWGALKNAIDKEELTRSA